uniref:Gustatory receptor n=1 Tax=Anopheles epiroticus TaxID=199890 RepID=A0A182PR57_9DIPT
MRQSVRIWLQAKPRHVFDVLKFNNVLCNLAGLNIYRFVGNPTNGVARLSAAKIANCVIVNLLLVFIAFVHANIPYEYLNNGSIIVTYGIRTLLVAGMFGTGIVIIFYAWNWRSVLRFLQELNQVDLTVLMKHPVDLATHKKQILLGSGLCLILHQSILLTYNAQTVMHIRERSASWKMVFGQFYFNVVYFSIVCLFFSFLYIVSFRFVHLNQVLQVRFDTSNGERYASLVAENNYRSGTVQERIRVVQKMATIYHQLTKITSQMNQQFADMLTMNIVVILLFSVFNVFALLKVYGSNDFRTRMFSMFNLVGGLYYTLMFLIIVALSQMVSQEVRYAYKLTGVLLHKAMNNETNDELIRSMRLFSRQIRNRSAAIGSRQIVIDWSFIFQVRSM